MKKSGTSEYKTGISIRAYIYQSCTVYVYGNNHHHHHHDYFVFEYNFSDKICNYQEDQTFLIIRFVPFYVLLLTTVAVKC